VQRAVLVHENFLSLKVLVRLKVLYTVASRLQVCGIPFIFLVDIPVPVERKQVSTYFDITAKKKVRIHSVNTG